MNLKTVLAITTALLLLSLQTIGFASLRGQDKQTHRQIQQKANKTKHDPPTSVPKIARLLGARVGFNGQDLLERRFGKGLAQIGGHPNGRKLWYTRKPAGCIETDGFDYNDEGLVLESLYWALDSTTERRVPFVHRLPTDAGWLGVVYPGMKKEQVSKLTAERLSAPQKQGDVWIWTAKGYVRPSTVNTETYTKWTARLTFQKERLTNIEVECE